MSWRNGTEKKKKTVIVVVVIVAATAAAVVVVVVVVVVVQSLYLESFRFLNEFFHCCIYVFFFGKS